MPLVAEDESIISYELQIDNGIGGAFNSVAGFIFDTKETEYTISGLNAGSTYRLRYRVRNFVGWSSFSPILYALCATIPSAPAPVDLVQATESTITLAFHESLYNGGTEIISYQLWMDDGFGSDFS